MKQALALDLKNGNTKWQDAIKTDLGQLEEFRVFRLLDEGETLPEVIEIYQRSEIYVLHFSQGKRLRYILQYLI